MAKLEKTLVVLLAIGLLMRLLHIDGGSIISLIAGFSLSVVYFLLGLWLLNGQRNQPGAPPTRLAWQQAGAAIIAGIVFSMAVIAALYTLMGWSGADVMRIVAVGTLLLLVLLVLALRRYMADRGRQLLWRSAVALVVLIGLSLLPPLPPPAPPTNAPAARL